jgi:hypothetical protein
MASPARQAAEMAAALQLAADPEVARQRVEAPDVAAARPRQAAALVALLAAVALAAPQVAEAGQAVPAEAAVWRLAAWVVRSDRRRVVEPMRVVALPARTAALHSAHRNVSMY